MPPRPAGWRSAPGGALVGERAEAHPPRPLLLQRRTGVARSCATHRAPVALGRPGVPSAEHHAGSGRGPRRRRRGPRRTRGGHEPAYASSVPCARSTRRPPGAPPPPQVHDRREVGGRRRSPVRLSACPGPLGSGSSGDEEQELERGSRGAGDRGGADVRRRGLRAARRVHPQRAGVGRRGPQPRQAGARGWPRRARCDGLPSFASTVSAGSTLRTTGWSSAGCDPDLLDRRFALHRPHRRP